jgi:hypothetical protein
MRCGVVLSHQNEARYVTFGEPDLPGVGTAPACGGLYPYETGPLSWTLASRAGPRPQAGAVRSCFLAAPLAGREPGIAVPYGRSQAGTEISDVDGIGRGYLRDAVNVSHASLLKVSVPPSRLVVSRTRILSSKATSTQSPPWPFE